jgi:uncharacterized RDD family membrane protein YckC
VTGEPSAIVRAQTAAAVSAGHPPDDDDAEGYAGLVTRGVAFAIDAAIINLVAVATAGVVGLAVSLFNLPSQAVKILGIVGAAAFFVWAAGYFVTFWSTTGQTIGARVMHIRVIDPSDRHISPYRAGRRVVAMVLGAIPCFLGYVGIVSDERCRAFHDRVAKTVVVYSRPVPRPATPGLPEPPPPR